MTLWIRVDANIGANPNVWKLAELLGVSAESCVGLCVILFGNVAINQPDGCVASVPDSLLESWAQWRGMPGVFSRAFREVFVTDGKIDSWERRQGKLIDRAQKERERWKERKSRGVSAETPRSGVRHDNDNDNGRTTPSSPAREEGASVAALRELLGGTIDPTAADDILGFVTGAPHPSKWAAEFAAMLQQMPGHEPATPTELTEACRHFAMNGERPNARLFVGYLRTVKRPPAVRTNGVGHRPGVAERTYQNGLRALGAD